MAEAILTEQPAGEPARLPYSPRAPGPRGGYRRRKLRVFELRVVAALRAATYATTYQLAKELNDFRTFRVVRNLVRIGLIEKSSSGLVITGKISLFDNGNPFWVPPNATAPRTKLGAVKPLTPHQATAGGVKEWLEKERQRRAVEREERKERKEANAPPTIDLVPEQIVQADLNLAPRDRERDRDRNRSMRAREVRAHSVSVKQMTKRALQAGRLLYPETHYWRPTTRGQCADFARPCPFVSCRYNLFLDVSGIGTIRLNFPDLEPDEMSESCVLDVCDRDGETLENVGRLMNITRERTRQIEERALIQLRTSGSVEDPDADESPRKPVRAHQRVSA